MARTFKKKYGKRKRYTKKRKYARKSKVKKTVVRMLAARGLARPEVKHFQYDALAASASTAFNQTGQSLLPGSQSTAANTIIGQKITAKYLRMRGSVYNGSDVDTYQLRIMVVKDLQPMAGTSLILNSVGSTEGYEILQTGDIDSFPNYNLKPPRFEILKDVLFTVGPKGQTKNEYTYNWFIPLGNAALSYAPAALTGMYPVNFDVRLYIVADTAAMYSWVHTDFAFTDV